MRLLTEGSIVHYVMPDGGAHRPAIVVRVCDRSGRSGCVNIQVFLDEDAAAVVWRTSVCQSEIARAPNTWHWPDASFDPAIAAAPIMAAPIAATPANVGKAKQGHGR